MRTREQEKAARKARENKSLLNRDQAMAMTPRFSRRDFFRSAAAMTAAAAWPDADDGGDAPGTGSGDDVPWLREVQQPIEDVPSLPSLLEARPGSRVGSASQWENHRKQIRQRWLEYLGPIGSNPASPQPEVIEEDHPAGVVRQLIEYEGEPGHRVRGYLIKPLVIEEKRPGVVVHHSTVDHTIRQPAGLEGEARKAFGLHLAQMGCVTFSPECFLWHNRDGRDFYEQTERVLKRRPGSKGMAKMLFDSIRALDVLDSLEEVDSSRVGTIGHSLGAKEALYLAAFDDRVKAAVSSEGGIGVGFSNWDAPWYLGEEVNDFGHDHHELLGLIAPRPFLLIGGDSADGRQSWPYIEAALQVYELFEDDPPIGLFNHEQGHSMPPVAELRAYQWLMAYL